MELDRLRRLLHQSKRLTHHSAVSARGPVSSPGKPTAVGAATAIVVGLVAITPAAGFVSPMSAILLGGIAAIPSYLGLLWLAGNVDLESGMVAESLAQSALIGTPEHKEAVWRRSSS